MTKRASIFEGDMEVDVSQFQPKPRPDSKAPPQEQVRAVAKPPTLPAGRLRRFLP
jgi:hypothetical protein